MKAALQMPIVFALASEPVATGYVASLALPGGSATGLSLEPPDLGGKRLAFCARSRPLTEVVYLASLLDLDQIKAAAPALAASLNPAIINNCPRPHVGVCRSTRTWHIGVTNFTESSLRSSATDLPSFWWSTPTS
jgi:hypothetical protein